MKLNSLLSLFGSNGSDDGPQINTNESTESLDTRSEAIQSKEATANEVFDQELIYIDESNPNGLLELDNSESAY